MKHKVIKKVLMCEPTYFSSLNYSINPWMQPGSINAQKSMQQWKNLVKAYTDMNIRVEVIPPQKSNPDMVFATDQGIVNGKNVLLSRFWTKERRGESKYYESWFREKGYTITYLPNDIYFEGNGDSCIWNDLFFVGVGYRADKKTLKALEKLLDYKIVPIQIVDPAFYHLDVGLFPLNNETIFYYPPAFSEETKKMLETKVPNLIKLTKEETNNFAANSIVTDHHVVHQKGNPVFKKYLKDLGYTSVEVDLKEFMKSGGGIHCLTNILEER